jgi:hypothetical protein
LQSSSQPQSQSSPGSTTPLPQIDCCGSTENEQIEFFSLTKSRVALGFAFVTTAHDAAETESLVEFEQTSSFRIKRKKSFLRASRGYLSYVVDILRSDLSKTMTSSC